MGSDNEIKVKVTADADGLIDVFGKTTGEVSRLADQLQKLDKDAFAKLSGMFKSGELDADEFRDALHKVTEEAQQMAAATKLAAAINGEATKTTKEVGEAAQLSAGGMRELVVVAREIATGNLTRLPGSLSILATRLGGIPPVAILAAGAIAGISYAIYEAINSSQQFESELATIQNSLTAVGEGNRFDRTEITAYIDELRQIPGIDREAAASIENEFSRSRNIGGDMMRQLIADIVPFSELIGKKVPDAAKEMAVAFNDPIKGLALLKAAGVEVSAATQEQIKQMMAVNDVAGAQRALLDGISEAMSHLVDSTTGLARFWNNVQEGFSGINKEAAATRDQLQQFAAQMDQVGDMSSRRLATIARNLAEVQSLASRNLPNANWTGSSGSIQVGDDKQDARDKDSQNKKDNDAVSATNKLFETGNSLLAEQEKHRRNIQVIQEGINAAQNLGDQAALKRAYADLEAENLQFYDSPKKPKRPKTPKDNTDRDFERELAEEERADQARLEGNKRVADEKARTEVLAIQQSASLKQVSVQEEIAQEIEAATRKQQIDAQAFDALLSHYQDDQVQYNKTLADKLISEEKFQQQLMTLRTKAAQDQQRLDTQDQKRREQMFAPVTRAFSTSIQGMVLGTQTFQQAFSRLGQSIVAEFANSVVKRMVDNWVLGETTKTVSSQIGAATRAAADTEGSNKSVQDNIINTGKQQSTDAVGVYSSVFNYLAPELGPFAAVPAALASASILALSLPSAAGGMIVPNDTLAMVHENEMVLPARYTQGLTNMIDQANGGGGSGHTFNNTFQISGVQAKDIPQIIDSHIQKQARNGAYGGMRTGR